MSNYDLQSQLSAYEAQLRRAQEINYQLRGELNTVVNGVASANRRLTDLNNRVRNTLDSCKNSLLSSHQRVLNSIELQAQIEQMYVKFKNVELANKKIRACNNKKYYDFANYRTVRKIVQGIMDNLDLQMVSDQAITKAVEVQHLQAPDYWLTCVLISVMAWRNDDKALAQRAIERALSYDKKSCAIFYMLFNLRMHRNEAALKWFYLYQECELKGSDQRTFLTLFSLVSKTLADSVEDDVKSEIFGFIKKVIEMNMKAEGYSEESLVEQIKGYFGRLQPSEQIKYNELRKHCTAFNELTSVMMQAKNNVSILELILKIVSAPAEQKNTFLKNHMDELIALPNQVEKGVYDEIAYNELIIKYAGDVETAKEAFASEQNRKASDLNLISEMIDWVYEKDSQEVNGQIRLNMFTLTKEFQTKAVQKHVDQYRAKMKHSYPVKIDDYSTTANFKDEAGEEKKIADHFTEIKNAELKTVKDWPAYLAFGLGAAALVAGLVLQGFLWLLIFTAGGFGFGLFKLISNNQRRKQIQQKYAEKIKITSDTMHRIFADFKQYRQELDEYDAYYDQICDALNRV